MRYYLDTEFNEYKKGFFFNKTWTIDLISIALVCEDNRVYYAISKDFDVKAAWYKYQMREENFSTTLYRKEYWLRENVLRPIFNFLLDKEPVKNIHESYEFTYPVFKRLVELYGKSNEEIAKDLIRFCVSDASAEMIDLGGGARKIAHYNARPEFYGYFSDYDWVVFCWVFGRMIDLPKEFPMYCRDLKQMLDEAVAEMSNSDFFTHFHLETPLDFQEKLSLVKKHPKYPVNVANHDAVADARWNYALHTFVKYLKKK